MGTFPPLPNTGVEKPIPGTQEQFSVGLINRNYDAIEQSFAQDRVRLEAVESIASPDFMFLARSDSYMYDNDRSRLVGSIGNVDPNRNLPYVELADTGEWHSPTITTERITPKVRGIYVVSVVCYWGRNGTGRRVLELRKNTTGIQQDVQLNPTPSGSSTTSLPLEFVELNGTTDYVAVRLDVPDMVGVTDYHVRIEVRLRFRT